MNHATRNTQHVSRFTFHASHFTLPALRSTLHALSSSLALPLFLFAIYLLTYTPRINSSDGLAMFATAESLVRRGAVDIEQIRWMDLQQGTYGLDGLLYSRKGIGLPVGLLPLTWLGLVVPGWGLVSASLLFNPIVTALTAGLLRAYLDRLGFRRSTGLLVALAYGLTTLAWPYAKSLFSDPFSGLLLLAAAYLLCRGAEEKGSRGAGEQGSREGNSLLSPPHPRTPAPLLYFGLAGLGLGWNVATRYAEVIFVPVFGLLLLYYLIQNSEPTCCLRQQARAEASYGKLKTQNFFLSLLAFATPILLIGLGLIVFNLTRYGDPFNTGYLPEETFGGNLLAGVAGQLVSPGRGLLLYCPVFLLSLVGLRPALRRFRPEALLALAVILVHLLLYGKWFMWHGGYAWGPRFMIPTLPFWALFLAPVVEHAYFSSAVSGRRSQREASHSAVAFLVLAGLGLIPQFLAVTTDFAPFQNHLLDTGLPLFAPETFFDPRYSPLAGGWAFLSPATLDLAWAWQGQVNGWLLAVLVGNIVVGGYNLWVQEKGANQRIPWRAQVSESASQRISESANQPMERDGDRRGQSFAQGQITDDRPRSTLYAPRSAGRLNLPWLNGLVLIFTLAAAGLLVGQAHNLMGKDIGPAAAALNEGVRPADAVITNDPELAQPFAEQYKGRAPVLGLNSGGFPLPAETERRLNELIAGHPQIWWLPNWLPPEQSAVEQTLLAAGFRARNDNFEKQRLVLVALPAGGAGPVTPVDATFAGAIHLVSAAYPKAPQAGAALPVELTWRAPAPIQEDYTVFIHLVNAAGQVVAQADGQPVLWRRPTSTWQPGETIVDRHSLWLSPTAAPGPYTLRIGLYRPADGQRLSLDNGEETTNFKVDIQ